MANPRIVFLDIETIPNLQQALENWCELAPSRMGAPKPTMSASLSSICSFGYRVLGEPKAVGINAWDFPAWELDVNDDRALCEKAYEVIKDADAIVTFNGKRFDKKFLQTRLGIHGLKLLENTAHIDLCQIVSSNFFLLNNRLKTIAKYFLNDSKMEHEGWPLWVKVHGGVKRVRSIQAEQKMGKYNLKDVNLMVPLFIKIRPLIKNIPNHNLFEVAQGSQPVCPRCGSTKLKSEGTRAKGNSLYRRLYCTSCGSPAHQSLAESIVKAL